MSHKKIGSILPIIALMAAGLWLVFSASGPREVAGRQPALQAFAPGGSQSSNQEEAPAGPVTPVVVNLADIPPGVYDPNNQFDRWQRGEIELDNEGILSEADMQALRDAAMKLPANENIQDAGQAGGDAPSPGTSFASLDYNECCGGGGNVPPDPELAVGPNHVIAVVNVAFEIYNKSGATLVNATTFSSFMASNPSCTGVFDPNALYDESADRFLLGIDANGAAYCLAVSQTSDPTGSWYIYAFNTGSGFFDYPHAGVGRDAIYMGGNIFNGQIFSQSRVWAFNKTSMYAGAAATAVVKSLPTSQDTPQPLNLHGWNQGTWPTSGPHYFITDHNYNGNTYGIWSWTNPFSTNTLSQVGTVDLGAYTGVSAGMPVNVPQSGGSSVQANDFRPQDFEYRNGSAWSVMTIACNPGSGTVDCLRWAKINLAPTVSILDAGVYSSNSNYRFFGDLAVDACENMAVGYTKSSSAMWPSIFYTGRLSTDPAGTLQAEAQLKAGEIAYTAFDSVPRRWGDYTEMTIAPDGTTFWYLGEYSKITGNPSGRWGTYIGSFSYSCNPGGPTPTPGPTATATATAVPTATATTPPAGTMHVGALSGSSAPSGTSRWRATVTITVHDQNHNPLSGVTVTGAWSAGASGSSSCTTGAAGTCTVSKTLNNARPSVTFTVTNLVKTGYTYQSSANHVSSIVVPK